MNNLSLYCGLVDAKIRASDQDLPVPGMEKLEEKTDVLSTQGGKTYLQRRIK